MRILTETVQVSTSPTLISPTSFAVLVNNTSTQTVYLGPSDVNTTNGYPLDPGEKFGVDAAGTALASDPVPPLYAVVASGTASIKRMALVP